MSVSNISILRSAPPPVVEEVNKDEVPSVILKIKSAVKEVFKVIADFFKSIGNGLQSLFTVNDESKISVAHTSSETTLNESFPLSIMLSTVLSATMDAVENGKKAGVQIGDVVKEHKVGAVAIAGAATVALTTYYLSSAYNQEVVNELATTGLNFLNETLQDQTPTIIEMLPDIPSIMNGTSVCFEALSTGVSVLSGFLSLAGNYTVNNSNVTELIQNTIPLETSSLLNISESYLKSDSTIAGYVLPLALGGLFLYGVSNFWSQRDIVDLREETVNQPPSAVLISQKNNPIVVSDNRNQQNSANRQTSMSFQLHSSSSAPVVEPAADNGFVGDRRIQSGPDSLALIHEPNYFDPYTQSQLPPSPVRKSHENIPFVVADERDPFELLNMIVSMPLPVNVILPPAPDVPANAFVIDQNRQNELNALPLPASPVHRKINEELNPCARTRLFNIESDRGLASSQNNSSPLNQSKIRYLNLGTAGSMNVGSPRPPPPMKEGGFSGAISKSSPRKKTSAEDSPGHYDELLNVAKQRAENSNAREFVDPLDKKPKLRPNLEQFSEDAKNQVDAVKNKEPTNRFVVPTEEVETDEDAWAEVLVTRESIDEADKIVSKEEKEKAPTEDVKPTFEERDSAKVSSTSEENAQQQSSVDDQRVSQQPTGNLADIFTGVLSKLNADLNGGKNDDDWDDI